MKRDGEGFVLYSMDDGASSQYSAPSSYSQSRPSQSSSGYQFGRHGHLPPPHTGAIRTNFTSQANRGSLPDRRGSSHTPEDMDFHHMSTPPASSFDGMAPRPFVPGFVAHEPQGVASNVHMWGILVGVILGCTVGALTHYYEVSATVSQWISFPGNLFVRAVQCVVIPLVFVNVISSVGDIVNMSLGKRVGLRLFFLTILTLLVAIGEGIATGFFARAILDEKEARMSNKEAVFGIQCSNGMYMQEVSNGLVACSAAELTSKAQFFVEDVNNALVRNVAVTSGSGSMSDNILEVLQIIVPENLMAAFVSNTLLSIVVFAIPCGVAVARSFHGPIQLNPVLEFVREINDSLITMVNWVMRFTPVAVLSLLGGSFGSPVPALGFKATFTLFGNLIAFTSLAVFVHVMVVMPLLFKIFARTNPYSYMRHLAPACVYALGSSSSMATLPVATRCIELSRSVSNHVMHFVMGVGTALNKTGSAIYLAFHFFFLVDTAGLREEVGGVEFSMLVLAVFIGTLAAPPMPGGSLAIVTTVWHIIMPHDDVPVLIVALTVMDAALDRVVTVCNVYTNAMICRIIEEQVADVFVHDQPPVELQQPQYPRPIALH
ncbi:hypothetical protein Poli38472_009667 [Pythium oligandrum]|uniref:Amino acid transporter n=1 Tax=Pythium oligandrum TaxID=41045 RepID=A0A8K1FIK4_PYTOL|nr:hypothetical protein Poli38472_009667 [Pythium oligandrum]|eukprot:TMW62174.1 hypothetical protein Poli38472_009667 [Pythium oligandrum]